MNVEGIMRTILTKLGLGLCTTACWWASALAVTGLPEDIPEELLEDARSSYIFVFQEKVKPGEIRRLAWQLTLEVDGQLRNIFTRAIRGFSANVPADAAARIGANSRIAYYEPNSIVWATGRRDWDAAAGKGPGRDDSDDDDDDNDGSSTQTTPWGIQRVGGPTDGTGLEAWILDTGIDLDHPDLNVGFGANFVTSGGGDTPEDLHGHGTHVAGTIAAIDNTIDVVGVAANAKVHPVRVLSKSGFGMTDWIVAGIDYVAGLALPGDCANMSLGGLGHQQSIHDAVVGAAGLGIRFAVAAGNDSADAEDYEPAHIDAANVYTISAIDDRDVFASFSNYGDPVDYAAPGVDVVSTRLGGGVWSMSGTSMATPHACGLLLFGLPRIDGYAIGDPDGDPDPIAHF
jgi:subtilisin family serine protease